MKHFYGAFIYTAICLAAGYAIGGLQGAWIVAVLGVLETSLSFDNAVVNATALRDMTPEWQHRFLTWGMVIAVFGMRLVFPLVIVSVTASIGPFQALTLALENPGEYARLLTSAHLQISAFGGAFLAMVALKFFIDEEKDSHWLSWFEAPMVRLGKIEAIQAALVLGIIATIGAKSHEPLSFITSGVFGLITYIAADGFGALMGEDHGAAKTGVAGFLYLELLDASFSFDGVIGAFALSNNLIIITLGLGIGAMFVRSLTLMMVEKKTLEAFRYLEHGAFWAIGALAAIMFASVFREIPDAVTGLIGAALIGAAFLSSLKKEQA